MHTELSVKTWYLQIHPGNFPVEIELPQGTEILLQNKISTEFYKYLYSNTGSDLLWVDRLMLAPDQLSSIIHDPAIKIFLLKHNGIDSGFAEIYFDKEKNVEIKYFGLFPIARGKGLGKPFLKYILEFAFKENAKRVWLHTCELDHPSALKTYLSVGFKIYEETIIKQPIPLVGNLKIINSGLRYPSEKLESARLILGRFSGNEAEELSKLIASNIERLKDYFPKTVDGVSDNISAEKFIKTRIRDWAAGNTFIFSMRLRENGNLIGNIIIKNIDHSLLTGEIGYYISSVYEGSGLMKEGIMTILNEAKKMGFKNLFARIEDKNTKSIKLAESCGFVFDRIEKNDFLTLSGRTLDLNYYKFEFREEI